MMTCEPTLQDLYINPPNGSVGSAELDCAGGAADGAVLGGTGGGVSLAKESQPPPNGFPTGALAGAAVVPKGLEFDPNGAELADAVDGIAKGSPLDDGPKPNGLAAAGAVCTLDCPGIVGLFLVADVVLVAGGLSDNDPAAAGNGLIVFCAGAVVLSKP
jgi:hypothetical protein